jgi:hypothetical protein
MELHKFLMLYQVRLFLFRARILFNASTGPAGSFQECCWAIGGMSVSAIAQSLSVCLAFKCLHCRLRISLVASFYVLS